MASAVHGREERAGEKSLRKTLYVRFRVDYYSRRIYLFLKDLLPVTYLQEKRTSDLTKPYSHLPIFFHTALPIKVWFFLLLQSGLWVHILKTETKVLIYYKGYSTYLKTGTLMEDTVTRINDSDHKVALPEETSLPRSLAEKLLDGGYFILRHTGSFISNVWKVPLILSAGQNHTKEKPIHPATDTVPSHTPRRQLSSDSRSDMETRRKARFRGSDKINPEAPVLSKTRKPGSSSNVNRKLFPGTPESLRVRQTRGEPDTRLKGNREMYPGKAVGTQDMQENTSGSVTTADQLKKNGTSHLIQLCSDGSRLDLEFDSPLEQHRHGQDKIDPEPTVLSKTGKPDSSSKVNSTPGPLRQDRLPDMMYNRKTVGTFYMQYKAKRIRWRANGIPNMRHKTNRKMYPRKAGGTPYMRYKANRKMYPRKAVGRLQMQRKAYRKLSPPKAVGTPYIRHKANRMAVGCLYMQYNRANRKLHPRKLDGTPYRAVCGLYMQYKDKRKTYLRKAFLTVYMCYKANRKMYPRKANGIRKKQYKANRKMYHRKANVRPCLSDTVPVRSLLGIASWLSQHIWQRPQSPAGRSSQILVTAPHHSQPALTRPALSLNISSSFSPSSSYSPGPWRTDGRPDMRYSENRTPGRNMDGTPDMRYSDNRIPGQNMDGTPDRRHLENRTPGWNMDGTPDRRCRANRTPGQNKDGTPDRRCKGNRR
ncbi:hypothetical protein Bbelb_127330 [Branchiostoma belcheri]|nr:hypothetical protein Bbelb_127330 [Branchiostoma belcheri]